MKKLKTKKGDVFSFRYNEATHAKMEKDWYAGYWRHCFEGTLVARDVDGEIRLVDTYWGIFGDGKSFSEKEALEKGSIEFMFNLEEVEKVDSHDRLYYRDEDLFQISEQHACVPPCAHTFKLKGAEKNNEKMIVTVNEQMSEQRRKIEYASDELQRLAVKKHRIEGGDLTVYL